jgi:hypothetical protein
MLPVQDAQLLTQEQNFEVLFLLRPMVVSEKVKQERDELCKDKVEHSPRSCTSYARQLSGSGMVLKRGPLSGAVCSYRTLQAN